MINTQTIAIIESNVATDDGYDGTEGYVVELDGTFEGGSLTLDGAIGVASTVAQRPVTATLNEGVDYFGRRTWSVS